ncbi:MAG: hypothetical protein LBN29_06145 [Mediterranea sp.]|nr:hypothetical protein [Mediterranea sp.]
MFSCTDSYKEVLSVHSPLTVSLHPLDFTTQGDARKGTIWSRASEPGNYGALTAERESAVNDLWYFEFDGDGDQSRCLAMGHLEAGELTNPQQVALCPINEKSIGHAFYLVANIGDEMQALVGKGAVVASPTEGTTLNEMRKLTFEWKHFQSTNGADFFLPMTGNFKVSDTSANVRVTLTRRVARVDVDLLGGEAFVPDRFTMLNLPAVASFLPNMENTWPADGQTDAFEDHSDTHTLPTFYLPENRRSIKDRHRTKVAVEGKLHGTTDVRQEVYLTVGGTYEVAANTRYAVHLNTENADISPSINLSEPRGRANCYIVNKVNTSYCFDARVQGNGVPTPEGTYSPLTNMKGTEAIVVWSMGGDTGKGINGVATNVAYNPDNGLIYFRTANTNEGGNALIALLDDKGDILWSWHVWKVDYDPYTTVAHDNLKVGYQSYTLAKGAGTPNTETPSPLRMMTYNLGTINTQSYMPNTGSNKPGQLGLIYEWGRKEPFLGRKAWNNNNDRYDSYTAVEYEWRDGSNGTSIVPAKRTAKEAIAYNIGHPTHFVSSALRNSSGKDVYEYDTWVTDEYPRDLWGNPNEVVHTENSNEYGAGASPNPLKGIKSCFDPCPPGWRVPPQDSWEKMIMLQTSWSTYGRWIRLNGTNGSFSNIDSGWYHALGLLLEGKFQYVGSWGGYWESSPWAKGNIREYGGSRMRFGNTGYTGDMQSYTPWHAGYGTGHAVRCCQE